MNQGGINIKLNKFWLPLSYINFVTISKFKRKTNRKTWDSNQACNIDQLFSQEPED